MAERRMFSKKIINSARFLKMPSETQSLYFHLGINADDDGVVEAFTVMRLLGMAEDNLRLLATRNFVKILNDDLVTYIEDWQEHNKIRADRKIDSIYKKLLIQIIPETKLLEQKQRADRKKGIGTSQGQPKDGIGKDRLGEVRLGNNNDDYIKVFEYLWDQYPNKKGKNKLINKTKLKYIYDNKDKIKNAIREYKKEIQKEKTEKRYIKHGSTFFNGGWEDYYKEEKPKQIINIPSKKSITYDEMIEIERERQAKEMLNY